MRKMTLKHKILAVASAVILWTERLYDEVCEIMGWGTWFVLGTTVAIAYSGQIASHTFYNPEPKWLLWDIPMFIVGLKLAIYTAKREFKRIKENDE